jgi:HD-like signal output (HDOD) protein
MIRSDAPILAKMSPNMHTQDRVSDASFPLDAPDVEGVGDGDHFAIRTRLTRVMQGGDLPVLSQKLIETITGSDDDVSIQRLANVVLREFGLALSLIRLANSAYYRRGGRPTESATHAMMVIGLQQVRLLAGSLLFFGHFQRRSPELRDLMVRSLLTANHARGIALLRGHDDPEAAHLAGMFRNIGEVLTACYYHDDYQRVRSLVQDDGRSEASAMRMVFGFSYDDFGVEVAKQWGLPETVTEGIRSTDPSPSPFGSIIACGQALTAALYQSDGNRVGPAIDALLASNKGLTRDQLSRVASDALLETREMLKGADGGKSERSFLDLATDARLAFGPSFALPAAPTMLAEPEVTLRERLRSELENTVDPASGATIGTMLTQAMEALLRCGPFDRVVTCLMTSDRTQLVARTGLGPNIESVLPAFSFPVTQRGGPVVSLTMQRQPLYLPTDRNMLTLEQRWADQQGVSQFGVFPIVVSGKAIGCLYCDRSGSGPAPDRATVRYATSIVDLVVEGIARRRNG